MSLNNILATSKNSRNARAESALPLTNREAQGENSELDEFVI